MRRTADAQLLGACAISISLRMTGDEDRKDSDFLAVIDLARRGDRYGTIVATAPVGEKGSWPHHTEHELGTSKPSLDRVVVALTYMPIPSWHPLRGSTAHDHAGNQVQVYRLSDLALLKTIRLPTNDGPNEPRVLQDGRTVLVNTGVWRLYHVTGLDGTNPQLEMIHQEAVTGCATPAVVGSYWISDEEAGHGRGVQR